ncbi:unnamed protein product [Rotaria sp. Silwood1]|nr:unnamed protein product [Rotaria sp. Silwood1]
MEIAFEAVLISSIDLDIFDSTYLVCFDSSENVRHCAIAGKRGSCVISHKLIEKSDITRSCENRIAVGVSYVSLIQTDNSTIFDVHCDRPFFNGHLTIQATKYIMSKYSITQTPDGKPIDVNLNYGLKLITSVLLMIIMIFVLFSNQY